MRQPSDTFLPDNAIHLWLADYNELASPRLHITYRDLLSEAEHQQHQRFHFERDRHRYLVTHALVRIVLSRYLRISPKDLVFATNSYGRPHLANVGAANSKLTFNISHTDSLIAIGIARDRALGVDVENILAVRDCVELAEHYFAPIEADALRNISPTRQADRFFEYWTFKESYIKARGMGLSLPLDKFSFQLQRDGAVEFEVDPRLDDTSQRWQFFQLRPRQQYILALCIERRAISPQLVVRKLTPDGTDQLLAACVSRRSEIGVNTRGTSPPLAKESVRLSLCTSHDSCSVRRHSDGYVDTSYVGISP
jgi:4'-phosphopantetheinyl transferase